MTKVTLGNGVELVIDLAPFPDGKRLLQAVCAEIKTLRVDGTVDMAELVKNIMCIAISSPSIDAAVETCMKRCTYKGEKIVIPDTFEAPEAREQYLAVYEKVLEVNLLPFTKSLYALFKEVLGLVASTQESKS